MRGLGQDPSRCEANDLRMGNTGEWKIGLVKKKEICLSGPYFCKSNNFSPPVFQKKSDKEDFLFLFLIHDIYGNNCEKDIYLSIITSSYYIQLLQLQKWLAKQK